MARLSMTFLGGFEAQLDGQAITRFESARVRALLIYLALEKDRGHARDKLATFLWPDQPERTAHNNLRQALANLRQAIGDKAAAPPFLLINRDTIQWNSDSDCLLDVVQFAQLLADCDKHVHRHPTRCPGCMKRRELAISLYRGHFLEHFAGPSPSFDEWALLKRERLHQQVLESLFTLATYHEQRGEFDVGYHYARRQLELDPWREEAHFQAMRLLAYKGQRTNALTQYEMCCRILMNEWGVKPAAAMTAFYERIRDGEYIQMVRPQGGKLTIESLDSHPLIGREAELSTLGDLLANPACRLITLTGLGGVGKTVLAAAAATQQAELFEDGAVFVPLASVSSAEFLPTAIAQAIHLPLAGQNAPATQLFHHLRHKEILILLDNFEQLLEQSQKSITLNFLRQFLQLTSKATLLITSRERLRLPQEWVVDLTGLANHLTNSPAVQLFLECTRHHNIPITDDDLSTIGRICHLLQGLPLAIELVATWVHILPCVEICQEIKQSLTLLNTAPVYLVGRHRTLQTTFDHSWQLLTSDEQSILRQLTVFRGSFDGEAAIAVTGVSLPAIAALVDKSLLRCSRPGYYDMHELWRQYAAEKLHQAGEVGWAQIKHLNYFVELVEKAESQLTTHEQVIWFKRLDDHYANIRTALAIALSEGHIQQAGRISTALWHFWQVRGYMREGREWLERIVALRHELSTPILAKALYGLGVLVWYQGDYVLAQTYLAECVTLCREFPSNRQLAYGLTTLGMAIGYQSEHSEARPHLEESVKIFSQEGDKWGLALALFHLGYIQAMVGEPAQAKLEESLRLFRDVGDKWGEALPLYGLGFWAYIQGDYKIAITHFEATLALRHNLGDQWLTARTLNYLGEVSRCQNQHELAGKYYEESLALYQALGSTGRVAVVLHNLGYVAQHQRETKQALAHFQESLKLFSSVNHQRGVAVCLEGVATVLADAKQEEMAVHFLGAASTIHARLGPRMISPADQREYERTLLTVHTQLDDAVFTSAWAKGEQVELIQLLYRLEGFA